MIVVFDLDGTLVDSGAITVAALRYATTKLQLPELPPDPVARRLFVGPDLAKALQEHYTLEPGVVDALLHEYRIAVAPVLPRLRPFSGVDAALRRIKKDRPGVIIIVLTNRLQKFAEAILGHAGIDSHFDAVIGAGPSQGALQLTGTTPSKSERLASYCALSSYAPSDSSLVVVGDRREDALVAQAVNGRFIRARWGYGTDEEFSDVPLYAEFHSASELIQFFLRH